MHNYRPTLSNIPPVVKNLIIINVLMWLATIVLGMRGIDLTDKLGLHYIGSPAFRPYQLVTHLFMHDPSGIAHIFFNMFALWMFGRILESVWGPKRFFIYYFVTGLGAAILHMFVNFLEYQSLLSKLTPEQIDRVMQYGVEYWERRQSLGNPLMDQLMIFLNTPTVGASGAVFGVLLGFGMLFPNTQLMLLFPPIPIKAKYFVIGYGVLELVLGLTNAASNIAHFAHLGGMLFGFILIKYWNKNSHHFY